MPEGHTIHRAARDHRRRFLHQRLEVSSPQGRFADGAAELNGDQIERIEAYGKHLVYHWASGRMLHIHLGLYGKFRLQTLPLPEPVGAVRLRLVGDSHGFDLRGPTCCELVTQAGLDQLLARLGPDPLRSDADPDRAWNRILRSRAAIGALLLDQSVIAGIGNVYRAEALFHLRIHPDRPGRDLSRSEFDALWQLMVEWLRLGVRYNRIITVDAREAGKTPGRLTKVERLMIYKKPACPTCDRPVSHWDCGNRTIYACRRCQK